MSLSSESASQSLSIQSIILELVNSFTLLNVRPFIWIPFEVSDGISNSNTIINHHSPISLCLSYRNWDHLHRLKIEKGDLINQSSLSSYSSLSIHLIQQYYYHHKKLHIQVWWIEVESDLIYHSFTIFTLKYYWMTTIECSTPYSITYLNGYKRRKILQFKWFIVIKWTTSNVEYAQLITIPYHTFAFTSKLLIEKETLLSNYQTL